MAKMTVAELEAQVRELQTLVDRITGRAPRVSDLPPEERLDYIAHGSPEHAAFLGLQKLEEGEKAQEFEGSIGELKATGPDGAWYTLQDVTIFGAAVRPEFLLAYLRQRVNELAGPVVPGYAPPMWRPTEVPASGITV